MTVRSPHTSTEIDQPHHEIDTSQQPVIIRAVVVTLVVTILLVGVGFGVYQTVTDDELTIPLQQQDQSSFSQINQTPSLQNAQADQEILNNSHKASGVYTFKPLSHTSGVTTFAFPINDEGFFTVDLPPAEQTVKQLQSAQPNSVSVSLLGSTAVRSSPDGMVVAYLTNDQRLGLITSDYVEQTILSEHFKVDEISWWSPDSQRLVVSVSNEDASPFPEGRQDSPGVIQLDKEALSEGAYVVDLAQGKFFRLPIAFTAPTSGISHGVLGWVGNDQLLINFGYTQNNFGHLSLFNIEDFSLQTNNIVPDGLKIFGLQTSFSSNGDRWAMDLWPAEGEHSSDTIMLLADFPSFQGSEISTGISSQEPLISPDGTKVAYRDRPIQNAGWITYVWVNGSSKELMAGIPLKWIDDELLIVVANDPLYSTNFPDHLEELFLVNTNTGKKTLLHSRSN